MQVSATGGYATLALMQLVAMLLTLMQVSATGGYATLALMQVLLTLMQGWSTAAVFSTALYMCRS